MYSIMSDQNRTKWLLLVIVLLLSAGKSQLCAQEGAGDGGTNYWISGGAGGSSAGFSRGGTLTVSFRNNLISLRYIKNSEFQLFHWVPILSKETVSDLGVLYGRRFRTSEGIASISVGIALVTGVHRGARRLSYEEGWFWGDREKGGFSTMGIPLEIQFLTPSSSILGFGIYGFANWNRERPFYGGILSIYIGGLE